MQEEMKRIIQKFKKKEGNYEKQIKDLKKKSKKLKKRINKPQ